MKAGTWKHYRIPPPEKKKRSKKRKEPEPDSLQLKLPNPSHPKKGIGNQLGLRQKGKPNDASSKRQVKNFRLGLLVRLKRFCVQRIRSLKDRNGMNRFQTGQGM